MFDAQQASNKQQIPKFIRKLYQILNINQYSNIISWDSSGEQLILKDIQIFQKQIIPKHFLLKKVSSFIRQLHLYDFHKIKSKGKGLIFHNELFKKNDMQQAKFINRKRMTKAMKNLQQKSNNKQKKQQLPQSETRINNKYESDQQNILFKNSNLQSFEKQNGSKNDFKSLQKIIEDIYPPSNINYQFKFDWESDNE